MYSRFWNRLSGSVLACCLIALVTACSSDPVGHTVPVRGTVTVAGKQLKSGSIAFWPDADKGNSSKFEAGSPIDENGNYELFTHGKVGAPLGAYKVTVSAQEPSDPKNPYSRPKFLVPDAYRTKESTPLRIEVVNNPTPQAYEIIMK